MASSGVRPIGKPLEGLAGSNRILVFNHRVVLGASGAIASQDAAKDTGVSVVKTAAKTGRYTITFANGRRFRQFRGGDCAIVGPTDVIYGANTVGADYFWRNDLLSTVGTLQIQFTRGDTNADAEVPDNFNFTITVFVKV
jgi:hypothetical protein